jgi:XPG N-terminal domain
MGIPGLLPVLKDVTSRTHIRHFQGRTAAIDAYILLYRGAYSCAEELCEGRPVNRFEITRALCVLCMLGSTSFRHLVVAVGVVDLEPDTPSSGAIATAGTSSTACLVCSCYNIMVSTLSSFSTETSCRRSGAQKIAGRGAQAGPVGPKTMRA